MHTIQIILMFSNNIRPGDVLIANFGLQDGYKLAGNHPCVFLWASGPLCTVVPITGLFRDDGTKKKIHNGDFLISKGLANLDKDSIIKVHQIQTLDIQSIQKNYKIGHLSKEVLEKILSKIKKLTFET